jgi:hypothetical protein
MPLARHHEITTAFPGLVMTCCHLLNDRPEKTIFPLESALILSQEPVKIVKKHLVEDCPFRMSRTIDSCHSKDKDSGAKALFPLIEEYFESGKSIEDGFAPRAVQQYRKAFYGLWQRKKFRFMLKREKSTAIYSGFFHPSGGWRMAQYFSESKRDARKAHDFLGLGMLKKEINLKNELKQGQD